jgi:hypothetical protein
MVIPSFIIQGLNAIKKRGMRAATLSPLKDFMAISCR